MTKDDIYKIASEAGMLYWNYEDKEMDEPMFEFARLIQEAERREIIAAIPGGMIVDPQHICDMIRARSSENITGP